MYYVYLLKSQKDKKLYIGYTNSLKRRLEDHNKGRVKITENRRPFMIIYYESYLNQQDATAREKYLKTGWGRNFINKNLKNYFRNLGR